MFFGRNFKVTYADVRSLIDRNADLKEIVAALYTASKGKYYLDISTDAASIAREYGAKLTQAKDIEAFLKVGLDYIPANDNYASDIRSQWCALTTFVSTGFVEAGGVKTVADAIVAATMTSGSRWDDFMLERHEAALIKTTRTLLVTPEDVLNFAAALKTYRGLMLLSIALGYAPSGIFEQAFAKHREVTKAAEAERSRTASAF